MGIFNQNLQSEVLTNSDTQVKTTLFNSSGDEIGLTVNDSNQLLVVLDGKVCTCNSTTTPLGIDGVFTGDAVSTLDYSTITVTVLSDQDSAVDGLHLEMSSDGVTWNEDDSDMYTISANKGKTFSLGPNRKYFRVHYVNGGVAQTHFDLEVIFKKGHQKSSSHRINDSIVAEDDAELVKSVITGENPAGTFVNFQATTKGNFKMSLEELENDISVNSNAQLKITQFDSEGNEGQKIIGVDYLAGNSGIDSSTETLQTINYEHHEIHSGAHYSAKFYADLAINNVYDVRIVTPAGTKYSHFTFNLSSESETQWFFSENVNVITAGTNITSFNNNRNSINVAGTSVNGITNSNTTNAEADTNTSGATILLRGIIGSGKEGGVQERTSEFVLKPGEDYNIRIIATAAGYTNFDLSWYEHTDKN